MAILMALSDPDVDVIAITCVEGNSHVKQTGLNALRTLKVAGCMDIPVYVGSSRPLLGELKARSPYHGTDGFGDALDPTAPDESHLQSEHGVLALLRLARMYQGELELVAIGPLTNVAMAIRMAPNFGKLLKACYIMGGNYLGKGNITVCDEFNFYFDPEAAYVVLNQLGSPTMIVPWETCVAHAISWETHTEMRNIGTPKSEFMKTIDDKSIEYAHAQSHPNFIPADEAIMACVLRRDVIKKCCDVYATVEVKGQYTCSQMVVDWQGLLKKQPNVTIITELDQMMYQQAMQNALTA